MSIPLPKMLRQLRAREFEQRLTSVRMRWGLSIWAYFAKRPRLYQPAMSILVRLLEILGRKRGRFRYLPFAHGWTKARDMPAPQGRTFQHAWTQSGDGSRL